MTPSPIRDVPAGYVVHRVGSTWLVFDRSSAPALVGLRLADASVRRTLFQRAPVRGRGSTPRLTLGDDLAVVLRRYRHGGLLGRITGALYLGPERALSELRVTAQAEASGAPVPHVLCLALWPVAGPLWSAMIGTREEVDARDLREVLDQCDDAPARRALLREVGAAIRKLHDAGLEHRDLQVHNILAIPSDAGWRIVVVDLDRAVFHAQGLLPDSRRADNLGRLARSAVKNGLFEATIGMREAAAFVGGYTAGNRELRAALRRWAGRERLKLALHRLRYRLIRSPEQPRGAAPPRPA